MSKFSGQVAVITGAAQGIGRAMAEAFAGEGATVVVADLNLGAAQEAAEAIRAAGGQALGVEMNVANSQQVNAVFARLVADLGHIEILVNNAGVTRTAMLHKMEEADWDLVINVHLKGTFLCTRAVVNHMREQGYGRIINVTSAAALVGTIGQVNYSAAKGGIISFTHSAARELAKNGVTVNAIAPSAATPMTEAIRTDPRFVDKYLERIPMGRWAEPQEIAPAVLFLASKDASYITGQVLCVDGGMVMR